MATKYTSIVANNPTFAEPGQKGARNVNSLKSIFPSFTLATAPGKGGPAIAKGNFGADGKAQAPVDLSDDVKYEQWFFDNVVNGVVESGWLVDSANGNSKFSMNYDELGEAGKGPPNLSVEGPLHDSKFNAPVATNSFVPFVATQDITQQSSKTGIPFTAGPAANDEFLKVVKTKPIGAPGVGGNAGTDSRNPAKTSSKQASPTMILGEFLKSVPKSK